MIPAAPWNLSRAENAEMLRMCRTYGSDYILIGDDYRVDIDLTR